MKKYALVKNGVVHSVFETDNIDKHSDIKDCCKPCPKDVQCNWLFHEGKFYEQPPAILAEVRKGEYEYVQPQVNIVDKSFSWIQFSAAVGAAMAIAAADYFVKVIDVIK